MGFYYWLVAISIYCTIIGAYHLTREIIKAFKSNRG